MRRLPALLFLLALGAPGARGSDAPPLDEARLRAMTARFVPVDIGADIAASTEKTPPLGMSPAQIRAAFLEASTT